MVFHDGGGFENSQYYPSKNKALPNQFREQPTRSVWLPGMQLPRPIPNTGLHPIVI